MSKYQILAGDSLEILKTLPDKLIQCCVTSPPYWGLRDYGVAGQLGLEKTPAEYVEKMVAVFREVKRVLRDDGTLWLNLGISYAGSWGDSGHPTGPKPPTVSSCDKHSTRSLLLQRVPACNNGGKVSQDFQAVDHACPGSCDEPQAETQNHHGSSVHNDQSVSQGERQTSQIDRDNGHSDCGQEPPVASLPGVQESTIEQSSCRPLGACDLEATALASLKEPQTMPDFVQESERKTVCTSGTSQMLPPLVVRTVGKESFFSACGDTSCKGIGRCGLCWCRLAIPSLNVKAKDEVNIPHLVAMTLQADGWFLRQTIILHKPNPMPESVKDRCTKSHEYIFLLSKSAKYFYDYEAIREQSTYSTEARKSQQNIENKKCYPTKERNGIRRLSTSPKVTGNLPGRDDQGRACNGPGQEMRNKRSVWTVTTQPYKEAHFATFPQEIPRLCISAGSKKGDTILDPFCGSGTTGEVALKLDRDFIGIELNQKYINDLIIPRLENTDPLFREAI